MAATGLCGACLAGKERPVTSIFGPVRYREPMGLLIGRAKFHGDLACGRLLGEILALGVERDGRAHGVDLLVPVPLGRGRLRERGYNQATEIARVVGDRLGKAVDPDAAVRLRETRQQSTVGERAERERNLRGAFAGVSGRVLGRRVAIVDDVVTTGATVYNLAAALRRAGSGPVAVWCCARAEAPHR